MVTLLYHRKLGAEWNAEATRLREALAATPTAAAAGTRPHVIGRARKQKVELDASYVIERLAVNGQMFVQKQMEGSFSQPNGAVCQHMLSWAQDVTRPLGAARMQGEGQGEGAGEGAAAAEGEGQQAGGPETDLLELYCGNGNFTVGRGRWWVGLVVLVAGCALGTASIPLVAGVSLVPGKSETSTVGGGGGG